MADPREIDIDPPVELSREMTEYLHENFARLREILEDGVTTTIDTGAGPGIVVVNGIVKQVLP